MSIMRSPGRCSRTRRAPHPPPSLATGERLSWVSSGLPWFLVSQDGVEDGEELAGDGDEGDHLGLAGGAEAIAEGLEDGVCDGWRRGLRGTGRSARSCGRRRSCSCPSTGRTGGGRGRGPPGRGAFFFFGGRGRAAPGLGGCGAAGPPPGAGGGGSPCVAPRGG